MKIIVDGLWFWFDVGLIDGKECRRIWIVINQIVKKLLMLGSALQLIAEDGR
jgi:hypothetical protein